VNPLVEPAAEEVAAALESEELWEAAAAYHGGIVEKVEKHDAAVPHGDIMVERARSGCTSNLSESEAGMRLNDRRHHSGSSLVC